MAKPVKRKSKVKKVEIIVEMDSTVAGLVPGLTARATVILQECKDVFVVPHECVYKRDSTLVIYIQKANKFLPHEISICNRADDFLVIEGNIESNDRLALVEPQFESDEEIQIIRVDTLHHRSVKAQALPVIDSLSQTINEEK